MQRNEAVDCVEDIPRHTPKLVQTKEKRRCSCGTILNSYNFTEQCAVCRAKGAPVHQVEMEPV